MRRKVLPPIPPNPTQATQEIKLAGSFPPARAPQIKSRQGRIQSHVTILETELGPAVPGYLDVKVTYNPNRNGACSPNITILGDIGA